MSSSRLGRRTQSGFTKIEAICAVVVAIATVIGTIVGIKQLTKKDPPPELAGDITGVFVDPAYPGVVRGQFELKGFTGKACLVTASVINAATNKPVTGFTDQVVLTLRPQAQTDRAASPMEVTLPTAPGAYFILVVLSDPGGTELDRATTQAVQVGPGPKPTTTSTTNPSAYPNAAERVLLAHIPGGSNTGCQRAAVLGLGDTAGVQCAPASGATAVWYYQFGDLIRLRSAYTASVTRTGISGGNCSATVWQGDTAITSAPGRILCYQADDQRKWVEWTNESLLIFARGNSPTVNVLFDWWRNAAGPI